jgi:two-component system, OmpR family, sensor histidine kinase KdpD
VDNIQLAESMGAEVVKLTGEDVAGALSRFAAEHGVTLAVVGETRRSRWYRLRNGSLVDRLLAHAPGLDVLVVSAVDRPDQRRAGAKASESDFGRWT